MTQREGEKSMIKTGDTVLHGPSGEHWIVAFVQDDRLAWCGWPPGFAQLSDCTLTRECTEGERQQLLENMADMSGDDARRTYARRELGLTS